MSIFRSSLLLPALLVAASPTLAAGIEGARVSASVHCCTAPPSNLNRVTETVTRTIDSAIEFAAGSIPSLNPFVPIIPSNIDFSADRIVLVYTSNITSSPGAFNGFVFEFSELAGVAIAGVSLDPISSFLPAQVGLDLFANKLHLSLPDLQFSPGTTIALNLALTPAVPEPAEWALLLTGLGLVGAAVRRRKASRSAPMPLGSATPAMRVGAGCPD